MSSQRNLNAEDFSEALGHDAMSKGEEITISVTLEAFEDDPGLVAALYTAIIGANPMRAKLTYRFAPDPARTGEIESTYSWSIYGAGDPERRMGSEVRRYLHHVYLDGLRDAAGDIAVWRKSPLRPLVDEVAESVDGGDLEDIEEALATISTVIEGLPGVAALAAEIRNQASYLVGDQFMLEPTLALVPGDAKRSLRALRVFLDGAAARDLSSASLGTLNILYIALLRAELAQAKAAGDIEHVILSIEEPEAHLHPHAQRRMFSGLREQDGPNQTTIVTTHSPHIVSVTAPQALVVLRADGAETSAFSASGATLSDKQWSDLGRYLDSTRSELVFARRVILVEGYAEQVLLQRFADINFDEISLSVCSIYGTHFLTYAQFLQELSTPFAVVTDGDPDKEGASRGLARAKALASRIGTGQQSPESTGIFVGQQTLEIDLYNESSDNAETMREALLSFPWKPRARQNIQSQISKGEFDSVALMKRVRAVSKGAYAQRLAAIDHEWDLPAYISDAIEFVTP